MDKSNMVRGHPWTKVEEEFLVQYVQNRQEEARTKGSAVTQSQLLAEAAEEILRKFGIKRTRSSCYMKLRNVSQTTDHASIDEPENEKRGCDSDQSELVTDSIKNWEYWSDQEMKLVYVTIKEHCGIELQNGKEPLTTYAAIQLAHNCLLKQGFTRTLCAVSAWWNTKGRKHFNYDEREHRRENNVINLFTENAEGLASKNHGLLQPENHQAGRNDAPPANNGSASEDIQINNQTLDVLEPRVVHTLGQASHFGVGSSRRKEAEAHEDGFRAAPPSLHSSNKRPRSDEGPDSPRKRERQSGDNSQQARILQPTRSKVRIPIPTRASSAATPNKTQAGAKTSNTVHPTQSPVLVHSSPEPSAEKSDLKDDTVYSVEFMRMLNAERRKIEQKIVSSEETQKHQLKRFKAHRTKAKEEMKAAEQVEREMNLERQYESHLRKELQRMQLVGSGNH
ncbi:hypothetical protein ACMFMG_011588 [Clarireedia jacksonii]